MTIIIDTAAPTITGTSLDALPPAPQPTDDTVSFKNKAFAWVAALGNFVTQVNAAVSDMLGYVSSASASANHAATSETNAASSANTASAAAAAALTTANAAMWVSGATYAQGVNAISAVNFLTYRRKTAGSGTTDPSLDAVNWTLQGVSQAQIQSGALLTLTSVNGTANAIAASLSGLTAYVAGQVFAFNPSSTNTGSATLNINALGARPILKQGSTNALMGGDLVAGNGALVLYDGAQFQLLNPVTTNIVQSGTGAVARTLQAKGRDRLSVKDFGAVGDGVTNDTAAVQAAINQAKAAGKALFFPAGNYLVTLSLDCTFADSPNANFIMFGEGKQRSIITGILTEQFPIVDYTGNSRGELRDLQVISTGAASKATAAFLSAKPALGGSRGNTVTVRDCLLSLPTSGNAFAVVGAVFYNTDLSKCINTECYGPGGATFGFDKPAGVTSKFQAIPATRDSTRFDVRQSAFCGESAPALEYTGGAAMSIADVYCALVGAGTASGIVRVSSPDANSGNSIYARALRTENQSTGVGVPCIHWKAKSTQVCIIGALETDNAGVMFKSDASISLSNVDMNVGAAVTGALFNLGGGICRARIAALTGSNLFGTVADVSAANTHDVEIRGGITKASVMAAIGACPGTRVVQGNLSYDSLYRVLVPPTATSVIARMSSAFSQAGIGMTAYAGGAEALIYTTTIKAAMLQQWDGNLPGGVGVLELVGNTPSSNAAGGRLRVQLSQGANNVDVLDTGAAVPAGAGNIRLTLKLLSVGGTNGRSYAEFLINCTGAATGAFFNKFQNIQGSGIVFNADVTVNVYATNTGANPWSFSVQTGLLQ